MNIDDLELRLVSTAVEVVQEHFLGQRGALAGESSSSIAYSLPVRCTRAVDLDRLGIEVHGELAGADDGLAVTLRAADDGVDARNQLVAVERPVT